MPRQDSTESMRHAAALLTQLFGSPTLSTARRSRQTGMAERHVLGTRFDWIKDADPMQQQTYARGLSVNVQRFSARRELCEERRGFALHPFTAIKNRGRS